MTSTHRTEWWRDAVTYQIYPRSFADANGDGIGDLAGIISRVPYLAALGIDAVWLSPFYPSELADGGYDVADPRDVDPRIGTLAEFDVLVARLREVGIRIIVDIVPNHSSDQRDWFQQALAAGPGSPERERYIFRDGRGEHGELPPNDWPSHFGPTCWTRVADGQWYLHLFAPEQPDLNWANPEVREDAIRTLEFWGDRGVAGFRIDVAHALVKDLSEPFPTITGFDVEHTPLDGSHPLFDRDEVHEIYRSWREVFDRYDPPLTAVAESWAPVERRARYASPEGLGQTFNFDLLTASWDAGQWRSCISHDLELSAQSGSSSTWVLSNHDVVRHATRYGLPQGIDTGAWLLTDGTEPAEDRALGAARARAAAMALLALPGGAYLYQGEELGLPEVADLPRGSLQDPIWLRSGNTLKGRDGCRVPIPWTRGGSSFGFGPGDSHLPQPAWFGEYSVEAQEHDESSMLSFMRRVVALRKQLQSDAPLAFVDAPHDTLHFTRGADWSCFVNFGVAPVAMPRGRVIARSGAGSGDLVEANEAVWLA